MGDSEILLFGVHWTLNALPPGAAGSGSSWRFTHPLVFGAWMCLVDGDFLQVAAVVLVSSRIVFIRGDLEEVTTAWLLHSSPLQSFPGF